MGSRKKKYFIFNEFMLGLPVVVTNGHGYDGYQKTSEHTQHVALYEKKTNSEEQTYTTTQTYL